MMKHSRYIKPLIAAIVVAAMAAALLPFAFSAGAAVNGVQKKLDEVRAVYDDGTYFTVSGEPCYSNQCDDCRLSLIPSRGGLPSGEEVCAGSADSESWSCRAFANYVFFYLFGERYWHLRPTETAVLGDYIKFNYGRHSAIYLWEDADNYYVYDGNGDSQNGVMYNRAYSKKDWTVSGIYHATSYDSVMRSGESAVYHELTGGRYGAYNVLTGLYLGSPDPADETSLYTLTSVRKDTLAALAMDTEAGAVVTVAVNETESAEWLPEPVAGGYLLRSPADPTLVLTVEDGKVILAECTGSAAQVWSLGAVHHRFEEEEISASTCAVHGEKRLVCSDCGYSCIEPQPLELHVYTVEWIAAGENSYGFTKYKCVGCGNVVRRNVRDKLDPDALVNTGDIIQTQDGYVYITVNVTEEALFDAFPGYEFGEAVEELSGIRLVPTGVESVPEEAMLTLLLPGDVDGDGRITAGDARFILRACVGKEVLTEEREMLAADIDFDGRITTEDARWILRTAVGYETGATTLAGMTAE